MSELSTGTTVYIISETFKGRGGKLLHTMRKDGKIYIR